MGQRELNRTITIDECDAALLAGALLLNDVNAVKEQTNLINNIDIQLWGNSVDALSKWMHQHALLSDVKNIKKFIEGNTPLHFAVLSCNFENISYLLCKDANPFLKNANGDKPSELIANNKTWTIKQQKKNRSSSSSS